MINLKKPDNCKENDLWWAAIIGTAIILASLMAIQIVVEKAIKRDSVERLINE